MGPAPLLPQPQMHHLPRLDPEHYRGFAAVLWTITFERRARGWLDPPFHAAFRELLLHVAAREQLFCPAYVLMPAHEDEHLDGDTLLPGCTFPIRELFDFPNFES